MKNNMQLFSCLFFTVMATRCMEENNPWKKIDCNAIEQSLNNDYHNYLKNRLEEYKKADFTPQDIAHLASTGIFITGNYYIGLPHENIKDEHGNNLMKIATQKQDLPIIEFLVKARGAHCISRNDFDACIATCTKPLHPYHHTIAQQKTAYEIIKTLSYKQGPNASIFTLREKSCRENLIKQLILLQIKHKKYGSNFVFEDELITQHLTSGENDQSPILLPDMYQTVANKKGNTLSHIIVELQKSDELYELINKNYVSPATNKENQNVLDIALQHFQQFTKTPSLPDQEEEKGRARCCLFMLLTYIKSKQADALVNYKCCDKHVIIL
jgi:hypothetical protein